jgi:hypothetical protein
MPNAKTQASRHPGREKEKPQTAIANAANAAAGHASAKLGASEANASPDANAAQTNNHFLSVISHCPPRQHEQFNISYGKFYNTKLTPAS